MEKPGICISFVEKQTGALLEDCTQPKVAKTHLRAQVKTYWLPLPNFYSHKQKERLFKHRSEPLGKKNITMQLRWFNKRLQWLMTGKSDRIERLHEIRSETLRRIESEVEIWVAAQSSSTPKCFLIEYTWVIFVMKLFLSVLQSHLHSIFGSSGIVFRIGWDK